MKLIFMDHDSVLCLQKQWGSRFKCPNKYDSDCFDRDCIQIVNEILIECPDTEIVISSDWRFHLSLGEMREMYSVRGIIKQPIGYTGCYNSDAMNLARVRADEINHWLDSHNIQEPWVAVDDLDMSEYLKDNFVLCSKSNEGIKQSGIKEKILNILKKNRMKKNLLDKVNSEISFILEHEDGLSTHDKLELNKLLLEKKEIEKSLVGLSTDLCKILKKDIYTYYVRRTNDIYDICWTDTPLNYTAEDCDDDGDGYDTSVILNLHDGSTLHCITCDVFKTKQSFMINQNYKI